MSVSSNYLSAECPTPPNGIFPSGLVNEDSRAMLVQAIKACLIAASKPQDVRPGLMRIHFEARGSELYLTATNGHICLTVEASVPHIDPCSFSVSYESAKAFVASKGFSALLPADESFSFPDVRQVIPTSFGAPDLDENLNTPRVGFSGLYLTAIGKILTALKLNRAGVESAVSLRHNGPCSPVLFETDFMPESKGPASIRGFALVVMPIRLN